MKIIWVFPKIMVPKNGWFIMENLIKMDDLGGNTSIFGNIHSLLRFAFFPRFILEMSELDRTDPLQKKQHLGFDGSTTLGFHSM